MVPRRTRRRSLILLGAGLAGLALGAPSVARARGLEEGERVRLEAGEVVQRKLDVELPEGGYFGGVSYVIVRAPPEEVMGALTDPGAYRSILPMLMEGRVVGKREEDLLVLFRHGGRRYSAEYVAIVRRESPSLIRFWMDPTRPHDVADCWGYFRVQPHGRDTLLSYGALLRLDFGLIKMLFTEKIRQYALDTPRLVRAYVEGRRGK